MVQIKNRYTRVSWRALLSEISSTAETLSANSEVILEENGDEKGRGKSQDPIPVLVIHVAIIKKLCNIWNRRKNSGCIGKGNKLSCKLDFPNDWICRCWLSFYSSTIKHLNKNKIIAIIITQDESILCKQGILQLIEAWKCHKTLVVL